MRDPSVAQTHRFRLTLDAVLAVLLVKSGPSFTNGEQFVAGGIESLDRRVDLSFDARLCRLVWLGWRSGLTADPFENALVTCGEHQRVLVGALQAQKALPIAIELLIAVALTACQDEIGGVVGASRGGGHKMIGMTLPQFPLKGIAAVGTTGGEERP
jgi:hypothetical protein